MPAAVKPATTVTFATAVETAATMGLSAAVEAVTAVELTASVEVTTATITVAAVKVSAAIAAIESTPVIPAAAVVAISAAVVTATIVAVASVSVITAIPGTGADEDAAREPVRSVIAVGRASVWVVVVVAVGAHGSRPVIHGTSYTDAKGDALGVRARRREETNSETNAE
jgi:hypothetical protein